MLVVYTCISLPVLRVLEPTFADDLAQTLNTVVFVSRRRICYRLLMYKLRAGWGLLCTHPLSTVRERVSPNDTCFLLQTCVLHVSVVNSESPDSSSGGVLCVHQPTYTILLTSSLGKGGGADWYPHSFVTRTYSVSLVTLLPSGNSYV